jgi:23S rRNA pseudouridine2605 synthase
MRLAKYLAHAGVASRRAAERLIAEGAVHVAGELVRDPARDVEEGARVEVQGRLLKGPERRVVYALHKPLGVLSTAHDPQGRPTVVDLIDARERLYPVGRLDRDSSGLILLTNDGALAHRLTHPSFEVPKTYRVSVAGGPLREGALRALREGVLLEDGPTRPACVRALGPETIEIELREGRNRQVRRMCAAVGHPVTALARVRIGALRLGELEPGRWRRLSRGEIAALLARAGSDTGA